MKQQSPPFSVDVLGRYGPGQVRVVWHGTSGPAHPQVEQLKLEWPRHVEEVTQRGGVLFNGEMVRYLGHRVEGGRLVLDAGPTDYATFYCTNYLNHVLGDLIGWDHFANPIGISANVITSDGWLLYGRRGERVACHANTIHTFGGTVEPADRDERGELDVFASMARELREELHLEAREPIDLICLGMIRDAELRQPELVFDARIARTRDDLVAALGSGDVEHRCIIAVANDPAACTEFVQTASQAVPVAMGSVALHVREAFGEAAYISILAVANAKS